jgi:MerR family transcriptional regulator, Zn(II)-responsive regulator of zntA
MLTKETTMLVNEIAQKSGIPAHVVRYYARIGLLAPSRNPDNGYQQFSNIDLTRIDFIRAGQRAGLNLATLNNLIEYEGRGSQNCCKRMHDNLRQRLEDKRQELGELILQMHRMERLLSEWGEDSGCNTGNQCICPRIEKSTA